MIYKREHINPGTDSEQWYISSRAAEARDRGESGFIVARQSYGQGSSREHAAICPMYLGIKAVIAVSIERIHQANLANFGILPLLFDREEDYERIDQGDELLIEGTHDAMESGAFTLHDVTKGIDIPLHIFASGDQRRTILLGGRLNEVMA